MSWVGKKKLVWCQWDQVHRDLVDAGVVTIGPTEVGKRSGVTRGRGWQYIRKWVQHGLAVWDPDGPPGSVRLIDNS